MEKKIRNTYTLKELEELGIDISVIAQVMQKKTDEVKQVADTFEPYLTKTSIFNESLKASREDIQAAGEQMRDFLKIIMWRYLENWCQVEENIDIIKHLENEIIQLGGDINTVREKYLVANKSIMK